jgi:hypothetical protein
VSAAASRRRAPEDRSARGSALSAAPRGSAARAHSTHAATSSHATTARRVGGPRDARARRGTARPRGAAAEACAPVIGVIQAACRAAGAPAQHAAAARCCGRRRVHTSQPWCRTLQQLHDTWSGAGRRRAPLAAACISRDAVSRDAGASGEGRARACVRTRREVHCGARQPTEGWQLPEALALAAANKNLEPTRYFKRPEQLTRVMQGTASTALKHTRPLTLAQL